jgi:hypothetical protein
MELIAVITISVSIAVAFVAGLFEVMNEENRFYSCNSQFLNKKGH